MEGGAAGGRGGGAAGGRGKNKKARARAKSAAASAAATSAASSAASSAKHSGGKKATAKAVEGAQTPAVAKTKALKAAKATKAARMAGVPTAAAGAGMATRLTRKKLVGVKSAAKLKLGTAAAAAAAAPAVQKKRVAAKKQKHQEPAVAVVAAAPGAEVDAATPVHSSTGTPELAGTRARDAAEKSVVVSLAGGKRARGKKRQASSIAASDHESSESAVAAAATPPVEHEAPVHVGPPHHIIDLDKHSSSGEPRIAVLGSAAVRESAKQDLVTGETNHRVPPQASMPHGDAPKATASPTARGASVKKAKVVKKGSIRAKTAGNGSDAAKKIQVTKAAEPKMTTRLQEKLTKRPLQPSTSVSSDPAVAMAVQVDTAATHNAAVASSSPMASAPGDAVTSSHRAQAAVADAPESAGDGHTTNAADELKQVVAEATIKTRGTTSGLVDSAPSVVSPVVEEAEPPVVEPLLLPSPPLADEVVESQMTDLDEKAGLPLVETIPPPSLPSAEAKSNSEEAALPAADPPSLPSADEVTATQTSEPAEKAGLPAVVGFPPPSLPTAQEVAANQSQEPVEPPSSAHPATTQAVALSSPRVTIPKPMQSEKVPRDGDDNDNGVTSPATRALRRVFSGEMKRLRAVRSDRLAAISEHSAREPKSKANVSKKRRREDDSLENETPQPQTVAAQTVPAHRHTVVAHRATARKPAPKEPPSFGIIMDSQAYVAKMMRSDPVASSRPANEDTVQQPAPVTLPSNTWGASFGFAGSAAVSTLPSPSSPASPLASTRPLSSWFLSKGAANFVKRVSFKREASTLEVPEQSKRRRMPAAATGSRTTSDGGEVEKNAFLASLTSQAAWRSWYSPDDKKPVDSLLDPMPTSRLPRELLDHPVEPMALDDDGDSVTRSTTDGKATSGASTAIATGTGRASELERLEQEIREEKRRARAFERMLLLALQGKAASGREFEDEYGPVLAQSRSSHPAT